MKTRRSFLTFLGLAPAAAMVPAAPVLATARDMDDFMDAVRARVMITAAWGRDWESVRAKTAAFYRDCDRLGIDARKPAKKS